jgi:hypothetical protein
MEFFTHLFKGQQVSRPVAQRGEYVLDKCSAPRTVELDITG